LSPGEVTNTDPSQPDKLSLFYARNSEPTTKMANHPGDNILQLTEYEVRRTFRRVKAGKAGKGIPPCTFKTCADQLSVIGLLLDFLVHWMIGLMDYYWTYKYTKITLLNYQSIVGLLDLHYWITFFFLLLIFLDCCIIGLLLELQPH